jgi:hypothetical protein
MTCPLPRFVRMTGVVLFLLVLATPAWAQDEPGFAKQGMYVGVGGTLNFTLNGPFFDGTGYYKQIGGPELALLPQLDTRKKLRGVVGFRSPEWALEFSYDRTRHQGTFLGQSAPGTFSAFNVDARMFALTLTRFQPHVVLGGGWSWLTVDNGSLLPTAVGNATFTGAGLNSEVGVTVFLLPSVGLSGGYAYRVIWFSGEHGVSNTKFVLRPRFRETNGSAVMMAFVTF